MVQYHDLMRSGATEYWKLWEQRTGKATKLLLNTNNIKYNKSSSQARLAVLYTRLQIGLPCYDKVKTDELREFCKARKLSLPQDRKPLRPDLVKALEEADENQTFNGFMDLPPELRVIIYTFHLKDISVKMKLPSQPPLLKVSRLVRKESFSLFYQTCNFNIHLIPSGYRDRLRSEFPSASDERFIRAAAMPTYPNGLQQLSVPLGQTLNKLSLRTYALPRDAWGDLRCYHCDIDFSIQKGRLSVTITNHDELRSMSEEVATELQRVKRLGDLFAQRGLLTEAEEEEQELWSDILDPDWDVNETCPGDENEAEQEAAEIYTMTRNTPSRGRIAEVAGENVPSGEHKASKENGKGDDEQWCSKLVIEDTDVSALKILCFTV